MKVELIRPSRREVLQRARYFASHAFLPVLIGSLLVAFASGQTLGKGSVEGSVFTLDSQGPSYVPGAKVTLQARSRFRQRRTKRASIASGMSSRDSTR